MNLSNTPTINPSLLRDVWPAKWVTTVHGKYNPSVKGVFVFRKRFSLDHAPERFVVHVSADNRYILYVNGHEVGRGPARSTLDHWKFESYDLADFLVPGENCIAARVWNWSVKPWGQQSLRTGFILQGDGAEEQIANTDYSWRVQAEAGWSFFQYGEDDFHESTGVGPCERVDGRRLIANWNDLQCDDHDWPWAEEILPGKPRAGREDRSTWLLEPRTIPAMEGGEVRLAAVRRSAGFAVPQSFCRGAGTFTVPAHSQARVLFDQGCLTVARPRLRVEGGEGSEIRLTYAEALYDADLCKGPRDLVEGRSIKGYYDAFVAGGRDQSFEPLWCRTYRYLEVDIETGDTPLFVHDLYGILDVYPFERRFSFESSDPDLERIVETGWRTARLCALENYVDCPYYEQLQYFGDLNISNPISVLLSGDSRLMRNAIEQGQQSITGEGLLLCAAPSSGGKIIPFFSISWIGMIQFYWMYTGDEAFVRSLLPSIDGILAWYEAKLNAKGMLGPMNHWNFVDSTERWPWAPEKNSICEPSGTREGNSSVLTLQFVYGLDLAESLCRDLDDEARTHRFAAIRERIQAATLKLCWDEERSLMADTPAKTEYSEHASILAALTDTLPRGEASALMEKLFESPQLMRGSLQFQAYLHRAMDRQNLRERYLECLQPWRDLLAIGLTTFPEHGDENTRSDCHAWNAYPAYELFTLVAGIRIAEPGYGKVRIEPSLGGLDWLKAKLPWREGEIAVVLEQSNEGLRGSITIPEGLDAVFVWAGAEQVLSAGTNVLERRQLSEGRAVSLASD